MANVTLKKAAQISARLWEHYPKQNELQHRALRSRGLGHNASPKEIERECLACIDEGKEETAKILIDLL
jgi:hypothetical protein